MPACAAPAAQVLLDLRAQQRLHAVVGELRPQLPHSTGRIAEKTTEGCAQAGLRPCAFEQYAIEDFNLIEMVSLLLEELLALLDGRLHHEIVIAGKGNLRPVLLEEILIHMEAGAEVLQRGLKPLDRIFLSGMVQALVVHAGNTQHHTEVAALGEEGRLIPKAIEIDVGVQGCSLIPRLDGSVDAEHQTTSTRGTLCLAAS